MPLEVVNVNLVVEEGLNVRRVVVGKVGRRVVNGWVGLRVVGAGLLVTGGRRTGGCGRLRTNRNIG